MVADRTQIVVALRDLGGIVKSAARSYADFTAGMRRRRRWGRGPVPMQMLCKVSSAFSDVQCPVCSQGFLVYWTRQRAGEREQQRVLLQQGLRDQHAMLSRTDADAHAPAFELPENPIKLARQRPAAVPATAIPLYS